MRASGARFQGSEDDHWLAELPCARTGAEDQAKRSLRRAHQERRTQDQSDAGMGDDINHDV